MRCPLIEGYEPCSRGGGHSGPCALNLTPPSVRERLVTWLAWFCPWMPPLFWVYPHRLAVAALAALTLAGCAADWRDRSVLSPIDQAYLETLWASCMYNANVATAGRAAAEDCASTTHRIMCHARMIESRECP